MRNKSYNRCNNVALDDKKKREDGLRNPNSTLITVEIGGCDHIGLLEYTRTRIPITRN